MHLPRVIRITGFATANLPLITLWQIPRDSGLVSPAVYALMVFSGLVILVLFLALASVVDSLWLLSAAPRAKRDTEAAELAPYA